MPLTVVANHVVGNKRAIVRLQKGYYNVEEAQALFTELADYNTRGVIDGGLFRGKQWESERVTIQVADLGVPLYKYGGSRATKTEPFDDYPGIQRIRQDICTRTGYDYNFTLYNSYTKNTVLGWHSDKENNMVACSPIIILSFGFPRRFRVRAKDSHDILLDIWLEAGDLLIMEEDCQELTEHCVWNLTKKEVEHFMGIPDEQMFRINLTGHTMVVNKY